METIGQIPIETDPTDLSFLVHNTNNSIMNTREVALLPKVNLNISYEGDPNLFIRVKKQFGIDYVYVISDQILDENENIEMLFMKPESVFGDIRQYNDGICYRYPFRKTEQWRPAYLYFGKKFKLVKRSGYNLYTYAVYCENEPISLEDIYKTTNVYFNETDGYDIYTRVLLLAFLYKGKKIPFKIIVRYKGGSEHSVNFSTAFS